MIICEQELFYGTVKNYLSLLPQFGKVIQYNYTWEEDYYVPWTTGRMKDIVAYIVSYNYLGGERSSTVSEQNVHRFVGVSKIISSKPEV